MRRIEILYEDDAIVVVNKPAMIFVHRAPGHEEGSLADLLAESRPSMKTVGSPERPGVVHRLDAETSGVMIFAKTHEAYVSLRRQFESHTAIGKTYLAIVHGRPKGKEGHIENKIGRKSWDSKRMAIDGIDGKLAISDWLCLKSRGGLSLLEWRIKTGRTHQIRVHSAAIGCAIAGDRLYGDDRKDSHLPVRPEHLMLHAVELSFKHPASGEKMTLAAEPPREFYAVWN